MSSRVFGTAFRAQLQRRLGQLQQRGASSSAKASAKPRTLEKPDRFRPPSHPQKLRKTSPIRQYGPELTAEERAAQRKKKYPNMMPPEGSVMHWFLTNRVIHLWISMGVLSFCGAWAIGLNFKANSPFYDLLPSKGDWLFHPFASISTFFHVYKLHTDYTTAQTAEKRKKELEEVQKRRAYRVAHGLEKADGPGMVPTTIPGLVPPPSNTSESAPLAAVGDALPQDQGIPQEQDSPRGPKRYKKWFGIW